MRCIPKGNATQYNSRPTRGCNSATTTDKARRYAVSAWLYVLELY